MSKLTFTRSCASALHSPVGTLTAVLTTALMTACAGGGGDAPAPMPTPAPTPTLTPAQTVAALQGIWQSASGAAVSSSTIVLPDGQLWSVISSTSGATTTTRLVKASLAAQTAGFGGSGKSYTLGTTTIDNVTAAATVVEKSSFSGTISGNGQTEPFALAYQARYDTPAVLAEFAGNWIATLGPGVVNWTVGSTGALTGSRTTGCTYTGQISLRPESKAVVNVVIAETCAASVTQLSGVGALSSGKTLLGLVMTTAGDTSGVAVNLARP